MTRSRRTNEPTCGGLSWYVMPAEAGGIWLARTRWQATRRAVSMQVSAYPGIAGRGLSRPQEQPLTATGAASPWPVFPGLAARSIFRLSTASIRACITQTRMLHHLPVCEGGGFQAGFPAWVLVNAGCRGGSTGSARNAQRENED